MNTQQIITFDDEQPIHAACESGNIELVRNLLDQGCDLNTKNKSGYTPLHLALSGKNQNSAMIALLLAYGAKVPTWYKINSNTPLLIKHLINNAQLMAQAREKLPANIAELSHDDAVIELAKSLLNQYSLLTFSNYSQYAKLFLDSIKKHNRSLDKVQKEAAWYVTYSLNSKTFNAICAIIASPEFKYFIDAEITKITLKKNLEKRYEDKRAVDNLNEEQKNQLDDQLKSLFFEKLSEEFTSNKFTIEKAEQAIKLVNAGAKFKLNNDQLLGQFLIGAYLEYQFDYAMNESVAIQDKNIQNYKDKCKTNPGHSIFIDGILRLVELGADAKKSITATIKFDGIPYSSCTLTAHDFIMIYKPEAAEHFFLTNACPVLKHTFYNTFQNRAIAKCLYHLEEISEDMIIILKLDKDLINFEAIITPENYSRFFDPRTAIGKVLWAKRKNNECSLGEGRLATIIAYLRDKYGISKKDIINKLKTIGILIDKNGRWQIDPLSDVFSPAKQNNIKLEPNHTHMPKVSMETSGKCNIVVPNNPWRINSFFANVTRETFEKTLQDHKVSLMTSAIKTGNVRLLEKLFEYDENLKHADTYQGKPLHTAVYYQQCNVISFLLKNGSDINEVMYGSPPLHLAIYPHEPKVVSFLLMHGANPNIKDAQNCTTFMRVLSKNCHDRDANIIIALLIAYGADIPADYASTTSASFIARYKAIKPLLQIARESNPADVIQLTKALLLAYVGAYKHQHIEQAQTFLDWIKTTKDCKFSDIQSRALKLATILEKETTSPSKTLLPLCLLITSHEFECFLAPKIDLSANDNTLDIKRYSL